MCQRNIITSFLTSRKSLENCRTGEIATCCSIISRPQGLAAAEGRLLLFPAVGHVCQGQGGAEEELRPLGGGKEVRSNHGMSLGMKNKVCFPG